MNQTLILTTKGYVVVNDDPIVDSDWIVCISADSWIPEPILCGGEDEKGYRHKFVTNHYTPTKKDYRKISATHSSFKLENVIQNPNLFVNLK
jgi:hypothetical protein